MSKQTKYSISLRQADIKVGSREILTGTLTLNDTALTDHDQAGVLFAIEFAVNNHSEIPGLRLHINEMP